MTPVRVKLDQIDHPIAKRYFDEMGVAVVLEHYPGLRWGIPTWNEPEDVRHDRYAELER